MLNTIFKSIDFCLNKKNIYTDFHGNNKQHANNNNNNNVDNDGRVYSH